MSMSWHADRSGCHVLTGADRPYHVVKAGSHWLADAWRTRRAPYIATFLSLDAAKKACEADAKVSVSPSGDAHPVDPARAEKAGSQNMRRGLS